MAIVLHIKWDFFCGAVDEVQEGRRRIEKIKLFIIIIIIIIMVGPVVVASRKSLYLLKIKIRQSRSL
jgi:hypothetical protein